MDIAYGRVFTQVGIDLQGVFSMRQGKVKG